jgi:arsenite methyltransferase
MLFFNFRYVIVLLEFQKLLFNYWWYGEDEKFFIIHAFIVSRHIEKSKGIRKMKTKEIKQIVKIRYGKFAETGGGKESCWPSKKEPGAGFAIDSELYGQAELDLVPEVALSLSRGCGNPTGFAKLQPGNVVVDFGCGGGIDVVLAANKVGPQGRVIGVDGAPQMIERAKQTVAEAGLQDRSIEFCNTYLNETQLPDGFADVVISNCVINLCPDKDAVYTEAFRILKPGGRLAISDVVLTDVINPELRERFRSSWAGCLGGAIEEENYWQTVKKSGFSKIHIVSRHTLTPVELEAMACCPGKDFAPPPDQEDLALVEGNVVSVKFTAIRPSLS